jgi:hypothetical protein
MKKVIISIFALSLVSAIAVASGCDYHQKDSMAENNAMLMFQIDDMKLMKYTSSQGNILYIIKNVEDEIVAKDLSQDQLASRYPEMAQKLKG